MSFSFSRIGVSLALLSLPFTAWADSNVNGPVIGLYPYTAASTAANGTKVALVFVANPIPNGTEGCPTHTPANIVYLDMADAQANTIYATLLAGLLSGQNLTIGVRGCGPNGAPLIYQVTIGSQS